MLSEQVELSLPTSPMQSGMFLPSLSRGTKPRQATAAAQTHTAQKRKRQCRGLRIPCLSSKGAQRGFLLPQPRSCHRRVFRDPGPLGRGRSLRASRAEYTQIQSILADFKQTAQEVREHYSTTANKRASRKGGEGWGERGE